MKHISYFTILVLLLSSCKYLGFPSGDDVVAKVGSHYLYEEDVRDLIPPGTPRQDSIRMLKQYVNSWALKYLLLSRAESELPKEERDVEKELEEYRNSLIAYRYEKLYINMRLDTLVTREQAREYYQNDSSRNSLDNYVVKARIVKISSGSPNLERIRSLYRSQALEDIDELERLCYNSADKYSDYDNKYTDLNIVARDLPLNTLECETLLEKNNYIETKDNVYTYLAFFPEIFREGDQPPFEYYYSKIKEIIISKRKRELIKEMEKDLLTDGIENNTVKTYINEHSQDENQY
jgi:hypothetical protein